MQGLGFNAWGVGLQRLLLGVSAWRRMVFCRNLDDYIGPTLGVPFWGRSQLQRTNVTVVLWDLYGSNLLRETTI